MPARILPDVAAAEMRAAGVNPLGPYETSKAPWRCECLTCHAVVTPTLASVRNGRLGCIHCGRGRGAAARRSHNAERAIDEMRVAGVEPLEEFPGRQKPWLCECLTCHQQVTPTLHSVRQGRGGCRFCGVVARADTRREDADQAAAEMRAAGFAPLEPYVQAHHRWRVRCMDCGAESTKPLAQVRHGNTGCMFCAPNAPITTGRANAAAAAIGYTPLKPYPGTGNEPWLMECNTCGKESSPRTNALLSGRGCAYCAGKRVDEAEAKAVMLAAGLVPLVDFPGSHSPWPCECAARGHRVSPSYHNISGGATKGCAYCSKVRVNPQAAVLVMRAARLEPLVDYPGTTTPWPCRCTTCGEEVTPRFNNVQTGYGGCSNCAQGFSAIALSIIYLMAHPVFQALKVGIGNVGNDRVGWHERDGWELLALVDTETGTEAKVLERSVLVAWRDAGYPYGVEQVNMPQRGYTETVPDSPDSRRLALQKLS